MHEAGAIEFTGHKVLTVPEHDGKMHADELRDFIETFYDDEAHEHMVFPGMVYISHPTEYGTLYTKEEDVYKRQASYLKKIGADTVETKMLFKSNVEDFIARADIIKNTKIINKRICIAYSESEISNRCV